MKCEQTYTGNRSHDRCFFACTSIKYRKWRVSESLLIVVYLTLVNYYLLGKYYCIFSLGLVNKASLLSNLQIGEMHDRNDGELNLVEGQIP